jgi:hypothetical protein
MAKKPSGGKPAPKNNTKKPAKPIADGKAKKGGRAAKAK